MVNPWDLIYMRTTPWLFTDLVVCKDPKLCSEPSVVKDNKQVLVTPATGSSWEVRLSSWKDRGGRIRHSKPDIKHSLANTFERDHFKYGQEIITIHAHELSLMTFFHHINILPFHNMNIAEITNPASQSIFMTEFYSWKSSMILDFWYLECCGNCYWRADIIHTSSGVAALSWHWDLK